MTIVFPSSLLNRISILEKNDYVLVDYVVLKGVSQGHFSPTSPRKRNNEISRPRSGFPHQNTLAPLPSLPEDDDTRFLRKQISDLESQLLDYDSEIESISQEIFALESKISELINDNNTSRISLSSSKLQMPKKMLQKPSEKDQAALAQYYKTLYEEEKQKLDGLNQVLSRGNFKQQAKL